MKEHFKILILLIGLVSWSACEKDDSPSGSPEPAVDYMYSNDVFTDAFSIAREAQERPGAFSGLISSSGVTVHYDTVNHLDTDTITVDFGNTSIGCTDGRLRRGKIIINALGNALDSLHKSVITFSNYYVGNDFVGGNDTIVYMGHDTTSGNMTYKHQIRARILLNSTGPVYSTTDQMIWITGGSATPNQNDDVLSVSGSGYGTQHSDGSPFMVSITGNLVKKQNTGCNRYFNAGTFTLNMVNQAISMQGNIGSGACDSSMVVTLDGVNSTEVMR